MKIITNHLLFDGRIAFQPRDPLTAQDRNKFMAWAISLGIGRMFKFGTIVFLSDSKELSYEMIIMKDGAPFWIIESMFLTWN